MKTSSKVLAFLKAQLDCDDARTILKSIDEKIERIGKIIITSSFTVDTHSSEKQFLYALCILDSNIAACAELEVSNLEYASHHYDVVSLWKLLQDHRAWKEYCLELEAYLKELKSLLTDDEKFNLLTYPESPSK